MVVEVEGSEGCGVSEHFVLCVGGTSPMCVGDELDCRKMSNKCKHRRHFISIAIMDLSHRCMDSNTLRSAGYTSPCEEGAQCEHPRRSSEGFLCPFCTHYIEPCLPTYRIHISRSCRSNPMRGEAR